LNKGGFSWRRLFGVSAAKSKLSRSLGVPLTRSGRHQKIGRAMTGGCLLPSLTILLIVALLAVVLR
jgi:hypothetical protein